MTSNPLQRRVTDEPWHRWLRRATVALGIWCVVLVLAYAVSRARMIYGLHVELTQVHADVTELQKEAIRRDHELETRLDDLERTLFGEVLVKIEQNTKTAQQLPAWSKNRDLDFRRQISNLQMRVFQLEQDRRQP